MAKSNYLFGLLLLSVVGVYIGSGSYPIIENQEPRTKSHDLGWVVRDVFLRNLATPVMGKADSQTSDFRPPASDLRLPTSDLRPPTSIPLRIKTIYDSQIGVRETGSNRGPEVEQYLRYVGLSKGNPWCAAFVCWVLGKAGVENPGSGWSPALFGKGRVIWGRGVSGIKYQVSGFPQSVPSAYKTDSPSSLATGNGHLATKSPATSDVFGIFFPEKGRIAHVGFVDEWDGSWLITVEGNTNTSGGREGDGVYRKRRLIRSIYRVARYIN